MKSQYDVYMCRERKTFKSPLGTLPKGFYNPIPLQWKPSEVRGIKPMFYGQSGKEKRIIRKVNWLQRLFGW